MGKYDSQEDINLMKKHLSSLRKIAGWTCEELGEMIGLSKQTISGLENNPSAKLSKAQYIALRTIFETEAKERNNISLQEILKLVFEDKENYKSNETDLENKIKMIAAASTAAVGVNSLAPFTISLLGLPAVTLGRAISVGAFIANKIITNKKK